MEGGAGEPACLDWILAGCVALGSLLSPFEPQFLHLQNGDDKPPHLTRLKVSGMMRVKGFALLLAEETLCEKLSLSSPATPGYRGTTLS